MKLNELFSPGKGASDVRWHRQGSNALGSASYAVDVGSGSDTREYVLNFTASYVPGVFEVSFALVSNIPDGGYSQGITGTGREFAVFSGMAEATRDFAASTRSADAFYFTAKEPSRAKAYRIMASRMANELGWMVDAELADMYSGSGWESEDSPVPFMVVRPAARQDLASLITGEQT